MKKHLRFLLFAIALAASLPLLAFQVDNFYYSKLNDTEVTVRLATVYPNEKGEIIIPATVTYEGVNYAVVDLQGGYGSDKKDVKSIYLPYSIREIRENSFQTFESLELIEVDKNNKNFSSKDGVLFDKSVETLIYCPRGKKDNYTIPDGVTTLGPYSFLQNAYLKKVKFPSSLSTIGDGAFYQCIALAQIDGLSNVKVIGQSAFLMCEALENVDIKSATFIGYGAFNSCKKLTKISIPASTTEIGYVAFTGTSSLQSIEVDASNPNYSSKDGVLFDKSQSTLITYPAGKKGEYTIPQSVNTIFDYAFYGNPYIASLTIPNSVSNISGSATFANCTNLSSLILSENLTKLPYQFISGCKSLKTLVVPASVTEGDGSFGGASLDLLFIQGNNISDYYHFFEYLSTSTTVIASQEIVEGIKSNFKGNVYSYDTPFIISDLKNLINYFSFKVEKNPYYNGQKVDSFEVLVNAAAAPEPDKNGVYIVPGFADGASNTIDIVTPEAEIDETKRIIYTFTRIKQPEISVYSETTQTTAKVTMEYPTDESVTSVNKWIEFRDQKYDYKDKTIDFTDLNPGYVYSVDAYVEYGDNKITKTHTLTCKSLNPTITKGVVGPTAITVKGNYTKGDANVTKVWFDNYEPGETLSLHGLSPNVEYTFKFNVQTDKGVTESRTMKIMTSELELKTLTPRCVSNSCAIVAAETNITDMEPNVGFQWKKYDAPASLAPSEGYAAVYDGMIEGYIKNLQSTSFYNTRAFYKTSSGSYYYGDWVTFDPSDFSFFEPTVHTYPVQTIGEDRATLRGYALAGTDAIISQGFQYWIESERSNSIRKAPASDMINTVTAFGQIMEITIDNLEPGTIYRYRAYVETSGGTKYGEEQTFKTEGSAGVDTISTNSNDSDATVVAYYDLSGRRYAAPQKGFNIVLYSNGKTKKILVK